MALHIAKFNVPLYIRDKRARKQKRRLIREAKANAKLEFARQELAEHFGRHSKIIQMLATGTPHAKVIEKRKLQIKTPPQFSILDNADSSIRSIRLIAGQMKASRINRMFVDLKDTTQYDLGANCLLDIVVDELNTEARQARRRIRWRGTFPKDPALARFVRALGVIKRLKIEHEYPNEKDEGKIQLFDERCRHYIRSLKPLEADRKSIIVQRFADHINKCLHTIGRKLTAPARSRFCQYTGEILDNAEQHAGFLDWSIQGYLDTQLEVPMCEVVIANFGRTIAESFQALPPTGYTRQQVQRYIDAHRRSGFFTKGWKENDLFTLIALQGNVSSKNNSVRDTRGNGTVELIEFFQAMNTECAEGADAISRMIIVSGSTAILFDGTYRMAPNKDGVKIIAFNEANDLEQPPDKRFVRSLDDTSFPGTLIGIKFALSPSKTVVATEHRP